MSDRSDEFRGELRVGRQLTRGRQVAAVGLAVAGGLLFLLSGPSVALVGRQAAVAGILAALVLGLTLANVLELLGGSGERGGTYVLIQETAGGWGAFIAGWALLAGFVTLSASLARAAGDHLLLLFPSLPLPTVAIALILFVALVLVQVFQVLPRRSLLWPTVVLLLIGLVAVVLSTLPRLEPRLLRVAGPVGLGDLMRSIAWLASGYAAVEAILSARRQVQNPSRDLPPAMLGVLLVGSVAFAILALVTTGLATPPVAESTFLAGSLTEATPLPGWIVSVLSVAGLLLATRGCAMTAARQMYAMSQEGGLPPALLTLRRPFRVPPLLFAVLIVLTGLLICLVPPQILADITATMFLVGMVLLNTAAIVSHRKEPDRRRPFRVPFYPLVPALAIAISGALLISLPLLGLLAGGLWLLIGMGVYLGYARSRQTVAREGISVFGLERRMESEEGSYRVLVPLSGAEGRHLLLGLAEALAHQMGGQVLPLQVIAVPDPLALEEGRRMAAERNALFQWSTRSPEHAGVVMSPITRLARSVPGGIIDTAVEEKCDLILMPWIEGPPSPGMRMGRVLDPVIRSAPCDVAVVAIDPPSGHAQRSVGEAPFQISRILVPTAGGPHAPLATRLAVSLAREHDATVTAIYVTQPTVSAEQLAEGERRIQETIEAMQRQVAELPDFESRMGTLEEIPIESRVVKAGSIVRGIAEAGKGYDLVFVGASNERLIDQVLFGSVPEQIARACPSPVIMVKRYRGLRRFWLQRLWDGVYGALPTLRTEERREVNKQIRGGAEPDIDFFVMMALASLIATLGLLQDSAAVIIGAMLVAPLFTPILALSLGIVQGSARLLRLAIEATIKGIALAIGAAVLFTAISPLHNITSEILARTQPNLFDLAVALASGAAGAYAVARKDVASSLPGVAIAAALVPPLATAGVGLAMGDLGVAGGGLLLFATNLIAIVLAGALTLLLLGFRPARRDEQEARLRWGLVTTVLLLAVITIPLTAVFVQSVSTSRTRQAIQQTLTEELRVPDGVELGDFEFDIQQGEVEVKVTLYAEGALTHEEVEQLRSHLSEAVGKPARLRVVTIPVTQVEASP